MNATEELFKSADAEYADFQAKLTPSADKESIIGVRVPQIRIIAKRLINENGHSAFLGELPHRYYDENMLHSAVVSLIKDYEQAKAETEKFLPYVDNWAVCDTLIPKAFTKNKSDLIKSIPVWINSEKTYSCRFGIKMLMTHFLDGDFSPEYLKLPATVESGEYYVNMMQAWFYATALAKQWDETIPYIEERKLTPFVHNKTISKAVDSYRITDGQKEYLKKFRIR